MIFQHLRPGHGRRTDQNLRQHYQEVESHPECCLSAEHLQHSADQPPPLDHRGSSHHFYSYSLFCEKLGSAQVIQRALLLLTSAVGAGGRSLLSFVISLPDLITAYLPSALNRFISPRSCFSCSRVSSEVSSWINMSEPLSFPFFKISNFEW